MLEDEKDARERKVAEANKKVEESEKLLHQRDKTVNELRDQITAKLKIIEAKADEVTRVKAEMAELQTRKEKEVTDLNELYTESCDERKKLQQACKDAE